MYKLLFSPIKINNLEIKNRIAYPSLGLLFSYDSNLNDRYYNYFKERAKGGAGIITVGPVGVDVAGSGKVALSLTSDAKIPSFSKLTKIIKDEGAKAFIQLFHAGAYSFSMITDGVQPIAPSAVYSKYSKQTPREMTLEDIEAVQQAFVDSALRAKEAGFDGVEVIGSAGYLITQFLSPVTNKRTDQYGGSFENRVRFPKELLTKLRKALGNDYVLGIRMAGNDFVPGSNTDLETPKIAKVYEETGVDYINVTGGWHEAKVPQLPRELPQAGYAYLASNIKKVVNVPVMASNRISTPDIAEKILVDNMADMVNLGRVLIADPYWPTKAKNGRPDLIRPCVGCNQGCSDNLFAAKPVECILNAEAGYEGERTIKKANNKKKIIVIGAGPAGCEAAIRGKQAGYDVELYEKENDIGGQLWIAAKPPHKHELLELIRYYKAMIKELDVPLFLNTEVDENIIKQKSPDLVIIAEGAKPVKPPIKGIDLPHVHMSWDILKEDRKLGKQVAVIGGGAVGIETAMYIAKKGTISPEVCYFLAFYDAEPFERIKELMVDGTSKVTIIEMLSKIGNDIGKSTKWIVNMDVAKYGIEVLTNTKVLEITEKGVVLESNGTQIEREYDDIIIATGSISENKLQNALKNLDIPHIVVGDAQKPGKLNHAIHNAYLAISKIDNETVSA